MFENKKFQFSLKIFGPKSYIEEFEGEIQHFGTGVWRGVTLIRIKTGSSRFKTLRGVKSTFEHVVLKASFSNVCRLYGHADYILRYAI